MDLTDLHFLNSLLVIALIISIGLLNLRQHRRGGEISPPLQAAQILAQLALLLQIYLGVTLLHDRHRRSLIHYSLGLLPILIFLATSWFAPRLGQRRTLGTAIAWLAAGLTVLLAFFLG